MIYNRTESFRHTFKEPYEATFTLAATATHEESHKGECFIIDISPSGAKIYSELNVPIGTEVVLYFNLLNEDIAAPAKIAWEKAYKEGTQYGIHFDEEPELKLQIIEQLKQRNREESQNK